MKPTITEGVLCIVENICLKAFVLALFCGRTGRGRGMLAAGAGGRLSVFFVSFLSPLSLIYLSLSSVSSFFSSSLWVTVGY